MTEPSRIKDPQGEPAMKCESVTKIYPSTGSMFSNHAGLIAVQDVSLEVPNKRCVALVGESGSGKSTLARMLLGLEQPTQGSIFLFGRAMHTFSPRTVAKLVQPVFQDPAGMLIRFSSVTTTSCVLVVP